jgi:nitrogen fixation-related uncharacterized protein
MNRKYLLLPIGILMLMSWVWIFGISTLTLISQVLNDEPYYFDNTFLYFLAFSIAPFVLNSYFNGLSEVSDSRSISSIFHKFNFVLLCAFNLLLLLLSCGFFFAFFDTFMLKSLRIECLLLLIPLALISSFGALSRFLYRTTSKQ